MGNTNSSFYNGSPNYATGYPTQNDTNTEPVTGNTVAPTSFYRDGTDYVALENADTLVATMNADLAAASAQAAASAASASAAAASAASVPALLATYAPLASPALTGTPTAPTPVSTDNSTKLSTTAYVQANIAPLIGSIVYQGTWNASTNSPTLVSSVGTKGWLYKVSVAGTTSINGNASWNPGDCIVFDGTTWDKIDGQSSEVLSVAGRTGTVTLAVADVSGAAPLASPALTGVPTAPTASALNNSTQLSTTAYTDAAVGVEKTRALAAEALLAPLASPALTGTPTAPTATVGTNTTQVATTAFVLANSSAAGVSSIAGNTGAFTLSTGLANTGNALRASLSSLTASLGADVSLNNTVNYFDGPSVSQGTSGTWFVSGTVTVIDSTGTSAFAVQLTDGTTVIAGTEGASNGGNFASFSLSGVITGPAGNLKIQVKDRTNATGKILAGTNVSKGSTITAVRIA